MTVRILDPVLDFVKRCSKLFLIQGEFVINNITITLFCFASTLIVRLLQYFSDNSFLYQCAENWMVFQMVLWAFPIYFPGIIPLVPEPWGGQCLCLINVVSLPSTILVPSASNTHYKPLGCMCYTKCYVLYSTVLYK
jgi:hypothetical protein